MTVTSVLTGTPRICFQTDRYFISTGMLTLEHVCGPSKLESLLDPSARLLLRAHRLYQAEQHEQYATQI